MKISDIKGLMPEKKEPEDYQGIGRPDGWNNFRREGFNSARDTIGESEFELDEKELAVSIIMNLDTHITKEQGLKCAKAIASALPRIIKVIK